MKTVYKALQILDLFSTSRQELNLTEVVRLTGFSKTTTHGLLNTLVSQNYLSRNGTTYRLGAKLFELGNLYAHQLDIRQLAMPHLMELANSTQDTAHLCIIDNDEALCIARVEGQHHVQVLALMSGGRLPLHTGAAPIVLLAGMSDAEIKQVVDQKGLEPFNENTITDLDELMKKVRKVRSEGYSISWEDITYNVAAIGAPVCDYSGKIVAAISTASIVPRFGGDRFQFLVDSTIQTAKKVSEGLGWKPEY